MPELVILKDILDKELRSIQDYLGVGGYRSLRRVLAEFKPDQVVEEVKKSGLRGRGGAGFPTGLKWSFIPKNVDKPKYMVVNSDESEPGTCKDRVILERNPHLLMEGLAIGSYAIHAHTCYLYIRGEYYDQAQILNRAIEEAYAHGFFGKNILGSGYDLDVYLHRGAGAYICGEETGLLESLEGKKGWPRLKPPFPAVYGLYGCPTVVNNVETLAALPAILEKGGDWYASLGTPKNGGTRLFCVSGHVSRPGTYELPMGTPLREIIYDHAGGMKNGKALKAVIPGGSSVPVLTADEIDVKMDFDSVAAIGSLLGSGGVVVMNEDTCMVKSLLRITKFYAHESCGQCTPCREGTTWLKKVLQRVHDGQGRQEDLDQLLDIAFNMMGTTICALSDAAAMPVRSYIQKFRHEFEFHVREKACDVALEGVRR
ncbi:MAG: NADH-quinone oxidoreductase subunit NuoF [Acidobacteriota bacterium]